MAARSRREDTRHDPESKGPTMDVLLPASRKRERRRERSDGLTDPGRSKVVSNCALDAEEAAATERAGVSLGKIA
jgi:hypothetical protein